MSTLSIQLSNELDEAIARASAREHISKAELVHRILKGYLAQQTSQSFHASALDKADDLVGCFTGGPKDLSSHPKHMAEFGSV